MPYIEIPGSPLLPMTRSLSIYYRLSGTGFPLIFLHGGWGYEVYPFDGQIEALASRFKVIIPDRTGYGRSPRINDLPSDFHLRGARETILVLDALGIERCILWGHSDGAVIAANMAILSPERFAGIVLEAFHYDRKKPRSRDFFEGAFRDPDGLGERIRNVLAREHGDDYWRDLLRHGARAWLEIAESAADPQGDLYQGRLSEVRVPTLFVHGSDDPRTEPDELDRVSHLLPDARIETISGGGHAPHAERGARDEVNRVVIPFLDLVVGHEAL